MTVNRNLKNTVLKEKKFIYMKPGRLSLRPKGSKVVQLQDSSFANIDTEPLFYETEGDRRMSWRGRMLDPEVPRDREILEAVEALLIEKPWMATDERYQIAIIGEYEAVPPWRGYDHQTAEQAKNTFLSRPAEDRPQLEEMMKYELERVEYDEELDENVSVTDDDKVKMLNELYRIVEREQKVSADEAVDLS